MLDVRLELESYQPIHLESVDENSDKLPENIKEAILLFNKALDDAKTGNEDIAVIALKKALSLHSGFYEAMNLLGVCYMAIGKTDMAEFAFKQVIDADDSGIKALEYLNKMKGLAEENPRTDFVSAKRKSKSFKPLDSKGTKPQDSKNVKSAEGKSAKPQEAGGAFVAWLMKGLQKENSSLYQLKYIVGIVIGVFLVTLIWFMVPTNKSLFTVKRVENVIKDPDLEKQISQQNEKIQQLEQDLQTSRDENQKLTDSFQEYKDWAQRLEQADQEFQAGNVVQSADLLSGTKSSVPEEFKDQHKALWDQVRLEAANQLYQEGNKLYNGNSAKDIEVYKQALVKFESAVTYLEDNKPSYMPILYYQAGKSAARCDETERAVELFEAITGNFPNSQYSSYAAVRLREIEEGRPISGN